MHITRSLLALALSSSLTLAGTSEKDSITGAETDPLHPCLHWEYGVESGYLWQTRNNTSIAYELATSVISFRSPAAMTLLAQKNGNTLLARNRASIIADYVVEGPEDYILTINGSPSIEYWFADGTMAFYFSPGGGLGLTNSQDVEGGQGQDFLLNWFIQSGVRYQINRRCAITVGAMFQHVSNGGQTDINPGIDALGFTVGFTKSF